MSIKPRPLRRADLPRTHQIILPWPPSVNKYWRMGRGHMHRSTAGTAYKNEAGMEARLRYRGSPLAGRLCVEIYAHPPDARARDLDNLLKASLDALKGIVYGDDSQIDDLRISRCGVDKTAPRLVVLVSGVLR